MMRRPDFDEHDLYKVVRELTGFVHGLEDRFPADDVPLLYCRLRVTVVDLGARIAESVSREGGSLSEEAAHEARGKLGELRHYFIVARDRFLLDENHEREFEALYERVREILGGGESYG